MTLGWLSSSAQFILFSLSQATFSVHANRAPQTKYTGFYLGEIYTRELSYPLKGCRSTKGKQIRSSWSYLFHEFIHKSISHLSSLTHLRRHAYHVNMPIIRRNRKAYLAELRTSITRPVSGHLGLHNDHMAVTFDVNRASYIFETLADKSIVTFACCPVPSYSVEAFETGYESQDDRLPRITHEARVQ